MLSSIVQRIGRPSSRLMNIRFSSTLAYTHSSSSRNEIISSMQIDTPSTTAPPAGCVTVKWLAAGIDPVDIAVASGMPSAASFTPSSQPAIAGTEGVGLVTAVGGGVTAMEAGDHVIPIKMGLGTWREMAEVSVSDVMRVPSGIRTELLATLPGSPCTASLLINKYCNNLKKGDVIVHSNASSSVGTSLIQIGKLKGFEIISIVDDVNMDIRDYAPTIERLKLHGSTIAIGQSHLQSNGIKDVINDLPKIKAFFHGGSTTEFDSIHQLLSGNCDNIVTYCPGIIGKGKGKKKGVKEFNFANWMKEAERTEVEDVVTDVTNMMEHGALTGWLQRVRFQNLGQAIKQQTLGTRKLVAMISDASH